MSELKSKNSSPLKGKGINELDNGEVSEDIYHDFIKNKKDIRKGGNTTEIPTVPRSTKNPKYYFTSFTGLNS